MWEQWKEKLKSLFHKKTENHGIDDGKHLDAKVTYYYPKNNSFRFPVIPDDETHKRNDIETPAYKRKKPERGNDKKEHNSRQIDIPNRLPGHEKISKKDTNVPFRPSKVPSPIHGFQEKKLDETVINNPAYKQKQENNHAQQEQISVLSEPVEYEDESNRCEGDKLSDKSSIYTQEPCQDGEKTSEITSPSDDYIKEAEGSEEIHSKTSPKKESVPHANQLNTLDAATAAPSNPTQQRKRRTESKQPSNNQKSVPFNVMMSHNDRKHARQSKKQSVTKDEQLSSEKNQSAAIPYYLLNDKIEHDRQDRLWVRQQQEMLGKTLSYFNVQASVVNATQGPSVTRFEVQPALGVKVSKVKNLSDDIKLNLAAEDIRMEAPIPGKNTIGIEIPNPNPQTVGLQDIFTTNTFQASDSPLTIGLGLTIEGTPSITNIQKMPHGLIAGATGSGKSVCINTILISLLYKADHKNVKFLLIDPKMVELAPYNGVPNLLSPVITDVKAATQALKWAVREMEDRYDKFVQEGARDVERYNANMMKHNRHNEKMPYIVIVIDELADLMMTSPQDVEDAISRIAQKARACGIHLLLATQRPSVDVITGLIKANIPTRIAFSVSSQVDSRTIIDTGGAEKLLGKGDMLFVENGAGKSVRLQGAFVSDDEIERVTEYARSLGTPEYEFEQEQLLEQIDTDEQTDELFETAVQFVVEENNASTSLLQRHFKIGYNRAARLMDAMAQRGIISEQNGTKPREILVSSAYLSAE